MRLGLDLRHVGNDGERTDLAREADRLGLWAILIDGDDAGVEAAVLATVTADVHLILDVPAGADHPLTVAEEIAVVDHLSKRRAGVRIDGPPSFAHHVRDLLGGAIVDGVALAPPPAQTSVPVWHADELVVRELTGNLDVDRAVIDGERDAGTTHLIVRSGGPISVLARHLVPQAAVPDFPRFVADYADRIAPLDQG